MRFGEQRYLTAAEAAAALGITRATLYAYASRGQLQSHGVPGRPRERRYFREDIERLREKKETRRDPARTVERGLNWGSPVLASGITLIDDGKLYYRGQDALKLAERATLEQVADLMWETDTADRGRLFRQPSALSLRELKTATGDPLVSLQAALPLAGAVDTASYDLRAAAVRQTGARIIRLMMALVTRTDSPLPVHRALQTAWAPRRPAVAEAIRTALVLCADHELNISAFTARCAASAGASPYDAISAALATLKGHRHGGATERISALFDETERPRRARAVIADRLRHGERLPGFGHPFYPDGDPRAAMLLRLAEASGNESEWRLTRAVLREAVRLLHDLPNLDFALVAIARTYHLPRNAPLVLFALGRTVGWIAHAIEQYGTGELIRPRARYTGVAPLLSATGATSA